MDRRVSLCGKVKPLWGGAEAKASVQRANPVVRARHETSVIYPWAGRRSGKTDWRTEPTNVEKLGDDLWGGVKV